MFATTIDSTDAPGNGDGTPVWPPPTGGDPQAFGRLVERYQRAVYATVYRHLGNDAETQEVCQEIFLRALRKMGEIASPCCFGGWFCAIAARMAINRASAAGVPAATCESIDARWRLPADAAGRPARRDAGLRCSWACGGWVRWIARCSWRSTSTAVRCWR